MASRAPTPPVFIDAAQAAWLVLHDGATLVRTGGDTTPVTTSVSTVRLQWTELTAAPGSGRLAGRAAVRARLEARGITPSATLVVAGDWLDGWGEDGHAWWALAWAGAARVHIVAGGMPAFAAALEAVAAAAQDGGRGGVPAPDRSGTREGPARAGSGPGEASGSGATWGPGLPELLARPAAVAALTAAGVVASNHDGSFREWAADPVRPVER